MEAQESGSEEEELQPQRPIRDRRQLYRLKMSPQERKKKKAQARQKPKTGNPLSCIWFRGARWIQPQGESSQLRGGRGTRGEGAIRLKRKSYFCVLTYILLLERWPYIRSFRHRTGLYTN